MRDNLNTIAAAGLVLTALASTAAALIVLPVTRDRHALQPRIELTPPAWSGSVPILRPLLSTLRLVPPERLLSPRPWARPEHSRTTGRVLLRLV